MDVIKKGGQAILTLSLGQKGITISQLEGKPCRNPSYKEPISQIEIQNI